MPQGHWRDRAQNRSGQAGQSECQGRFGSFSPCQPEIELTAAKWRLPGQELPAGPDRRHVLALPVTFGQEQTSRAKEKTPLWAESLRCKASGQTSIHLLACRVHHDCWTLADACRPRARAMCRDRAGQLPRPRSAEAGPRSRPIELKRVRFIRSLEHSAVGAWTDAGTSHHPLLAESARPALRVGEPQ